MWLVLPLRRYYHSDRDVFCQTKNYFLLFVKFPLVLTCEEHVLYFSGTENISHHSLSCGAHKFRYYCTCCNAYSIILTCKLCCCSLREKFNATLFDCLCTGRTANQRVRMCVSVSRRAQLKHTQYLSVCARGQTQARVLTYSLGAHQLCG